ncbi:DUF4328 domain-containing protein [Parvularcula dongshanensis]|uniref:DUF4328 domain-containing protein n=1 Tax=Parvularcula dongshanensis TaxID=1173995 RepID=A0A840I0L8_9PROT|nr:DUF4328 domain-containing protein [Parvularcula dongshanensis]MBB4657784.1 hypothetical protein [Parvularcula dongshanensis]
MTTIEHAAVSGGRRAEREPKPLDRLYKRARWSLIVFAGLAALMVVLLGMTLALQLDTAVAIGPGSLAQDAMLLSAISFGYVAATFVTPIFVAIWLFRAMRNLHAVKEPYADMSAGWAIGWYFVPIAAWWKPFEAMQQIVDGSYHAAGWRPYDTPSLGGWWALWIVGSIGDRVAGLVLDVGNGLLVAAMFSATCLGSAALLLQRIMGKTTAAQSTMMATRTF